MTALRTLIEAVEAGEWLDDAIHATWPYDPETDPDEWVGGFALRAYHGSVDAALALMEAVLPGWRWNVGQNVHSGNLIARVYRLTNGGEDIEEYAAGDGLGKTYTPARALLLAILKALEATNAGKE